ncbi:hypothetical protein OS493_037096, partial [Desmophyllum pertusum]
MRSEERWRRILTDQCEKAQTKVECSANSTCVQMHGKRADDKEVETRGCFTKSMCDSWKKLCGDDDMKKAQKIKECAVACCDSDGDTPCNSGFTVCACTNMMMM